MATPNNLNQNIQAQVKETAEILENTLKSISENIKDIFETALASTDSVVQAYGKDIEKGLKSMVKSTDKMIENEVKLRAGILTRKDIQSQIVGLEAKREILQLKINNLGKEDLELKQRLTQELEAAIDASNDLDASLRSQDKHLEEIDKRVGGLGAAFKGLSKIPLVGQLVNAEEALTAMKSTANQTSNRLQIVSAGLKEATKNASTFVLAAIGKTVVDRFKAIDTANENLARNLGVSYDEANKLTNRYVKIAEASQDIYVTSTKLAQTTSDLSSKLGIAVALDDKRLQFATKLREQGKFSVEATNEITALTAMRGEDEEKVLKQTNAQITAIKLQTGVNLNNRAIIESVSKASAAVKMNFRGSVTEIAKASATTKALGLELNKVEDIAGGLLDFESSIQAQMEAELLTGKALNVDKARYQALTNDTAGLAKTIAQDLGTAAEYGKMNRIQQEGLAKAYGMSREEVSQMLLDQDIQRKLGGKSLEDAQKEYALAVQQGKEEQFLADLGDKELAKQFEQNSLQTRQQAIQEKLASSMDRIAKALLPVAELFQKVLGFLSKFPGLIQAATIAFLAFKAASMFGKGSFFSGGGMTSAIGALKGGGNAAAAGSLGSMGAGAAGIKGLGPTVAPPPPTSAAGLSIAGPATAPAAATATTAAASSGGGFFSNLVKGAKSLVGKLNPVTAIKAAVKEAGGVGGLLKKAVKGSILNTLLTALFGYMDFKSLIENPVDEEGKPLSKDELNRRAGKIVLGSAGGILGGIIGTALGGPIGSMVGSFGGQWLMGKLADWFPSLGEAVGGLLVPDAIQKKASGKVPGLAVGGVVMETGIAKVDRGEVYLGANSITVLRDILNAIKGQGGNNQAPAQIVLRVDGQTIANTVAMNVPTSYGNVLNPGSSTYRR